MKLVLTNVTHLSARAIFEVRTAVALSRIGYSIIFHLHERTLSSDLSTASSERCNAYCGGIMVMRITYEIIGERL